jgi:hypothetical protein
VRTTSRRGWIAFGSTVAATLWGLALVAGAFFLPLYAGSEQAGALPGQPQPSSLETTATLVEVNGIWVLAPVAAPALLALLVWAGLHRRCARGSRAGELVALAGLGVLFVFTILTGLSIGPLLLPMLLLLLVAVMLTERPPAADSTSP